MISTAPAGVDMVYGCTTLGVEGPTAAGDQFCGDSYSPDTLGGVGSAGGLGGAGGVDGADGVRRNAKILAALLLRPGKQPSLRQSQKPIPAQEHKHAELHGQSPLLSPPPISMNKSSHA